MVSAMNVSVTPHTYEADTTRDRLRAMAIEIRARELYFALACAVAGAPNWRNEAKVLLGEIAEGIVPEPPE
jgi:hypothetical protein